VVAYFEDALAKALDERIDGVEIERRPLGTGRTIGVRADGFVIMFALAPVRGGHPFRRSLRRRGVVDLTGTLIVSNDAADVMVLAGDRPGRLRKAARKFHETSNIGLSLLAVVGVVLSLVDPWLCLPFFLGIVLWSADEAESEDEVLALPEPESAIEITAVHLWSALCDDVGKLVSATNLVPALIDGDQAG